MKGGISRRAASLKTQAKARAAKLFPVDGDQGPVSAPGSPLATLLPRIERTSANGLAPAQLRVIVAGDSAPYVHDFSDLIGQPMWAELMAEGFRAWSVEAALPSRVSRERNLKRGFTAFLKKNFDAPLSIDDIDEAFWTAFLAFLNGPNALGASPLAIGTRRQYLMAVKLLLVALRRAPDSALAERACFILDQTGFPNNAWPGAQTKVIPKATLPGALMDRIALAAAADVATLKIEIERRNSLLHAGRERLNAARGADGLLPQFSTRDFADDLGLCCAWIQEKWPRGIVTLSKIKSENRSLYWAIEGRIPDPRRAGSTGFPGHKMGAVTSTLFNPIAETTPFVLLIALLTAFNLGTVLELNWDDLQAVSHGERHRIRIVGDKARAAVAQTELHDAEPGVPLGLSDVLESLERLTERSRAIAPLEHRKRLFVGIVTTRTQRAKSFEKNKAGNNNDITWKWALGAFIKKHGLPHFTLGQIRPSVGEAVYEQTGGDLIAVQRRLHHVHIQTTRNHYTSDRVRRDGQERIAGVVTLLTRWVETEGTVDPRGRKEWDRNAATPGWLCLDPFDSPQPGEKPGRLCTAYGRCVICPLAATRIDDIYAAACHRALIKAIYSAQGSYVSSSGWKSRWEPVLRALIEEVMPNIPADIAQRSSGIDVILPSTT